MAVSEPSLLVFTAIKYFFYIYTLIQLVVTPTLTQMPTVVGQPELESKDFNPCMKIRMISIILCDDYFQRSGYLKFYADRLNKSWGSTLGIVQLCYLDLSLHSIRKARTSNYRGADKSLARPASRCILFDGKNISYDASYVIYLNSTNIPPIMIINRIYEYQNLLSL